MTSTVNKQESVYVKGYGNVTRQEVANMDAVGVAELQMFVDAQCGKLVNIAERDLEAKLNKEATGKTRIVYSNTISGKVDMLVISIGNTTELTNMSKTDMLSKAVRLNAKVSHLTRHMYAQCRGVG